jgi:hypothetical protein
VTVVLLQKIVCLNTAFSEIFMFEGECNCAHFRLLCLYGCVMPMYMFVMLFLDTAAVAAVTPVTAVAVVAAVTAVAAIAAVALVVVHPVVAAVASVALVVVHPVQLMVVVFVIV